MLKSIDLTKTKELIKVIKENLSIIILLPTVLGGIWQTLELISIDLSFLRFFSVTQLVSDGIVALSLLTFFF